MKLFAIKIFLLLFIFNACFSQKGKVIEGLSLKSKLLGYDVNYSIYLPPDYYISERSYPIVYLLHGYSDNETAWVQFGHVNLSADEAIESGEIPPMIIVMPDAKITWYVNDLAMKNPYEDMFFEEFIPHVENEFRVRSEKAYRGISGLSMGGYGSLIYSLRHPDMFVACAAFSAGILTDEEIINLPQEKYEIWFGDIHGKPEKPEDRINDHWNTYSVLYQVKKLKEADKFPNVKLYLDCGDDDFLYKGNSSFHVLLKDLEIYHEYRVRNGAHNWEYWRTGIIDGLSFIGNSFHR